MLITLFTLFLAADAAQSKQILNIPLEIYESVGRGEVATLNDGKTAVLHRKEAMVYLFDENGKQIAKFGGKGAGPGEMKFPLSVFADQNRIYVPDLMARAVHFFDWEGKYIDRKRFSGIGPDLIKVSNGWVFGAWSSERGHQNPGDPTSLVWIDDNFENEKVLAEFQMKNNGGRIEISIDGDGDAPGVPFNPAMDMPRFTTNDTGTLVYFWEPGPKLNIDVFDVKTGEKITTLNHDVPQVPYNREWAEKKLQEMREKNRKMGGPDIKFTLDAGEYFPVVNRLFFLEGKLYVRRWAHDPEASYFLDVLDPQGSPVKGSFNADSLERILGSCRKGVWVHTFTADDDHAALSLIAAGDVNDFVKATPLAADDGPALMMITE